MLWVNEKVKDHFQHPRNYGPMDDSDAIGEIGNKICGDRVRLFLKLDEAKSTIVKSSFQVHGCPTAIAAASAMTEMIVGKTLEEATHIKDIDISDALGGYPEDKIHCCTMAEKVLKAALVDAGAITGNDAEKIKCDALFLSVTPGGTAEMLTGIKTESKEELSQIDKLQLIIRIADDLGIKILDVNQSKKHTIAIKISGKADVDEFKSRLNRSLNDEIVII